MWTSAAPRVGGKGTGRSAEGPAGLGLFSSSTLPSAWTTLKPLAVPLPSLRRPKTAQSFISQVSHLIRHPMYQAVGLWVFLPELAGLCQGPLQWLWLNVKYSWLPLFSDPFHLAFACGSLCPLCVIVVPGVLQARSSCGGGESTPYGTAPVPCAGVGQGLGGICW